MVIASVRIFRRGLAGAAILTIRAGLVPATARAAATTTSPQWIDDTQAPYNADPTDATDAAPGIRAAIAYMAVTLPPTTTLNRGWTICSSSDNGKVMSVQPNGMAGGLILMPGLGGAQTHRSVSRRSAITKVPSSSSMARISGCCQ
jgi:hypothetical protein